MSKKGQTRWTSGAERIEEHGSSTAFDSTALDSTLWEPPTSLISAGIAEVWAFLIIAGQAVVLTICQSHVVAHAADRWPRNKYRR